MTDFETQAENGVQTLKDLTKQFIGLFQDGVPDQAQWGQFFSIIMAAIPEGSQLIGMVANDEMIPVHVGIALLNDYRLELDKLALKPATPDAG